MVSVPTQTLKSKHDFTPDQSFIENAEEFVRLHLLEELTYAIDMFKIPLGREWLLSWHEKRNLLIKKAFLNPETDFNTWLPNWRKRLRWFHSYQMLYVQSISSDWTSIKQFPWPKIIFDPISLKTIDFQGKKTMMSKRERDLANPLATNEDIDYVLRFHRPYTDEERKKIEEEDAAAEEARRAKNDIDEELPEDINIFGLSIEEINKYRTVIKKYHVIDRNMILNLQKARYQLLRESFQGKRMSELHYQQMIFQAERVITAISLWKNIEVFQSSNNKNFDSIILPQLEILTKDNLYRRYMNFDDRFFKGNIFCGYKNRYDDPSTNGYRFEFTAKIIVGNRFASMKALYNDINKFNYVTGGIEHYQLNDLPIIDSFLDRYKTWTFWFSQRRFNPKNWLNLNTPINNDKVHLIKPLNFKTTDFQKQLLIVTTDNDESELTRKKKKVNSDSQKIYEISEKFKEQTIRDAKTLKQFMQTIGNSYSSVISAKANRYLDAIYYAKLLPTFHVSPNEDSVSSNTRSQKHVSKMNTAAAENEENRNTNDKRTYGLNDDNDYNFKSVQELLDIDKNSLIFSDSDSNKDFKLDSVSDGRDYVKTHFGTGADEQAGTSSQKRSHSSGPDHDCSSGNSKRARIHH